jgi:DNA polymerase-1
MANDTLYLVDGSAYIFRAFFAIRGGLSNTKGMPTNALYGFTSMIRKLLEQEDPKYLSIVLDPFGSEVQSFRKEMYDDYKANRSAMPDDLRVQIPYFDKIIDALKIHRITQEGYEADDVIATLTKKARAAGMDVCIVSADKDLMQLLEDDHVRMIDTMRDRTFTPEDVVKKFGVGPEKARYVMALAGDSSDNVPGVPGIGPKTGGKLIDEFGDLETLLANIDKVSGKKRKENLEEFADQARLSLQLVTLKYDCDVELDLDELVVEPPDMTKMVELFGELSFGTPLREIKAWMRTKGWEIDPVMPKQSKTKQKKEKDYETVLTEAELDTVIEGIRGADRFAFDLETTSMDPLEADIVGVAIAWESDHGVYIPTGHRDLSAPKQLPLDLVLERLKPFLENADEPKVVCQHFKYEWIVLQKYGVNLRAIEWDTMLMSYLIDPDPTDRSQGLDAIAKRLLRYDMTKYEEVAGKGAKQIGFDMVDVGAATKYAAEDADITLIVCNEMEPVMERADLKKIHDDIELPLSVVLAKMEMQGVCVDRDVLGELSKEFEKELDELQAQIDEAAGEPLNANSPTQLREVLFGKLGLPVKKRTKTGPSTDQSVLEQLAEFHELPDLILEYRSFSKLKGTYVDALPELIREESGRIHTDFNQAVAATGRLSSSNPNLQNIPIRTSRGREIRRAFVPQDGWRFLTADYSQIELRIMAHMSQDPKLVNAYKEGIDVHRLTASEIFDVPFDEVEYEQRAAAKTVNFGIMYGMGPRLLSRQLKISTKEAKSYIEKYFERYEGVTEFFDSLVNKAREKGYAETLFGRRRILEAIDGYGRQKAFAERVAVNMPIQGTAADIIKVAMIQIQRDLEAADIPMNMLLQVHDELVFEVSPEFADEAGEFVQSRMEGVIELDAPLVVEWGMGDNWLEAK